MSTFPSVTPTTCATISSVASEELGQMGAMLPLGRASCHIHFRRNQFVPHPNSVLEHVESGPHSNHTINNTHRTSNSLLACSSTSKQVNDFNISWISRRRIEKINVVQLGISLKRDNKNVLCVHNARPLLVDITKSLGYFHVVFWTISLELEYHMSLTTSRRHCTTAETTCSPPQ